MCGIVAIISFNNHRHNLSRLEEMAGMIRHRGPDDEGYALFDLNSDNYNIYYGGDTPESVIESELKFAPKKRYQYPSDVFSVGLAHRRLSIIDLSSAGHQPMCDENGRYWIVYNGEIYNFVEIREELKKLGFSFFSNTDTEVILKAYIAWGDECQNRFNGMWACTIWDNREKNLWISRDRFGVKPLYYMFNNNFFMVFSEIKSIMPIIKLLPNYQEMYAFLLDGQSEAHPETFFENIFRFPSGHSSNYRDKCNTRELEFNQYWNLDYPTNENSFSERKLKEYSEEYYSLLKDSVKLRLYADVNVSCALSGGLDSSSITFLAHQILSEQGSNPDSLMTVSNVFNDKRYADCDESNFIDSIVSFLNIKSFKSEPDNTQLKRENDYGLWCYENCYDFLSVVAMNTFKICKRNNIKVNLDGQGADEINAGYLKYWSNFFAARSFMSIDYLTSLFFSQLNRNQKLRAILGVHNSITPGTVLENRFQIKVSEEFRSRRVVSRFTGVSVNGALYNSINFNLKHLLRNIDSYSMASSIESRQPFMDYRLISFMNSIPYNYKLHKGWTKYLARIAFKNKLPDNIVWRKDKLGWPQPSKSWISGSFGLQAWDVIKNSHFLKDLLSSNIIDDDLPSIKQVPRPFFRLYNLARHYEIFFNNHEVFHN